MGLDYYSFTFNGLVVQALDIEESNLLRKERKKLETRLEEVEQIWENEKKRMESEIEVFKKESKKVEDLEIQLLLVKQNVYNV